MDKNIWIAKIMTSFDFRASYSFSVHHIFSYFLWLSVMHVIQHPVLHENNEPDYEAEVLHEDNEPDYEAEVLHEDNEPDYEAEVEEEVLHDDNEPDYEAEGDATFCKRDYSHALDLYTMVIFSVTHLNRRERNFCLLTKSSLSDVHCSRSS
jgi:hypothetical protein